ncbi:MAG TPA: hypothetical protein VHB45_02945 [Alloacidobacterium sp.]|nr:hypothetical protein [Alloacidobacterium sp.]
MSTVDRLFGWLLGIGTLGHATGCWLVYKNKPELLLWSECATLAGLLLAAINLLRVGRSSDSTLAWVSFFGCVAWAVVAVAFGRLIGNMLDFRPLLNLIFALGLAGFSLRAAVSG